VANALEIATTDSARFPYPLGEVIAVAARPTELQGPENTELIFTSGETHWSADVAVRLRLADATRQEANRRRLLEALATPGPLWDPARHPELEGEGGSAAWVEKLRGESEQSFEKRTRGGKTG
jgi:hypothetical protein